MNTKNNNINVNDNSIGNIIRDVIYLNTPLDKMPDKKFLVVREAVFQDPESNLFEFYMDEGISSNSGNRPEFNQMLEDAKNGKFDRIVTYSLSCFSRNLNEALEYVRELSDYGVNVKFVADGISTEDDNGLYNLGVAAAVLECRRKLHSDRVKAGIKAAKERKAKS